MSDGQQSITIMGERIPTTYQELPVVKLRYLKKNPRVYSSVFGIGKIDMNMPGEELQTHIHEVMVKQPSVKNLKRKIKSQNGLMDPILVREDTLEVVEGNSRLAAYSLLEIEEPGSWQTIPCFTVCTLTDEQLDAYLNQMHVDGKTPWTPYEKANIFYVRHHEETPAVPIEEIARRFETTKLEVDKQINIVKLMRENNDHDQSKFSYYGQVIKSQKLLKAFESNPGLREDVIRKIGRESPGFKASELRDQLPIIAGKPKLLRKFIEDSEPLEDIYNDARPSKPHMSIRKSKDRVKSITAKDLKNLEKSDLAALEIEVKRLRQSVERLSNMISASKSGSAHG